MRCSNPTPWLVYQAWHRLPAYSRLFWTAVLLWLVPQVASTGPLTLGSISLEPAAEVRKFLPLARYLAHELRPDGIDDGRVIVAGSIRQMAAFIREGKVDLYIDSSFPTLAVSRLSGSRLLLRRWKKGIGEYYTVIFARQESEITRLEDLKGKMIAFEEPFSSSGYFFPKRVLVQAGLTVVRKGEAADPVGPEEVGYVFSNTDESTIVWVLRGKVAAGAMDHQTFLEKAKGSLPRLKIVHETFALPRHLVSYRADLSSSLVTRIKSILLEMDQREEGRKALHAFEGTTKFDDIPEHAKNLLETFMPFIEAEFGHP
jgi:ABC-type phosphate/phosphonate transport system substrate-binding protein